jgi:hypothetical protein
MAERILFGVLMVWNAIKPPALSEWYLYVYEVNEVRE